MDYTSLTNSSLVFSSEGATLICVVVSIIDDNDVECDEVFTVSLATNYSTVMLSSDNTTATVTIQMDPADG